MAATGHKDALKNTKMCSFYMRHACMRGAKCTFAHDQGSLRDRPVLDKTVLCDQWRSKGTCSKGSACKHAHGSQELRAVQVGGIATNPQPDQLQPLHPTSTVSMANGNAMLGVGAASSSTGPVNIGSSGSSSSASTLASSSSPSVSELLIVKNTFICVKKDKDDGRHTRSLPPLRIWASQ
eukprot:TRINITY_DN29919_c0_g1_i2.p1 TRINITY_DN29919_c0_g1~~TRINITY_DN29919_c0_g1_i2.p1  ORF type:complete len:203 (-),score=22.44 TRINITY_DN29919_c0_g1_i2:113-652(-)